MKRAFTLIELLVVIAIIAILAAILFPVFAQAKVAAKKAASISNQKQIGTSIMLYTADYDDVYPRNDDCTAGSALNPALNSNPFNPTGAGCTGAGPFYYRMNHYSWHKWIMPYTKNVDMFWSPAFGKANPKPTSTSWAQWSDNGQIYYSYAINLALTGALDTYNRAPGLSNRFRNSFLNGTQTAIPDVAGAMLLTELVNPWVNYASVFLDSAGNSAAETKTAYPLAIREAWIPYFKKGDATTCTYTNENDATKIPFSGKIVLGYADGHAKAIDVNKFLADTPTAAEYTVSSRWACGFTGGSWTISAKPVWTKSWPMWALEY